MRMNSAFVFSLLFLLLAGPVWAKDQLSAKTLGNPKAPQGGVFYYNIKAEPASLNAISGAEDLYNSNVHEFITETLLRPNDETYALDPSLAERYDISPDGKTFTFYLRKNVKWQDGEPFTSEDVKFSYDAIFNPDFNAAFLRTYYDNIEKVETPDAFTVRFTTKSKYFNNFLQIADMRIVPKHFYGKTKEDAKKNKVTMGTGPYILEKYEQGQRITLTRNPNWWGNSVESEKGKYNFKTIVIRFVKDDNIALEMLKKGDIDFVQMNPEMYMKKAVGPEWGKSVLKIKAENKTPKGTGFIAWNLRRDLFKDRDVRLALAHLMNRDLMNQKFRYGMSLPATGPWYQQNEYADPTVKAVTFDPKKANELLQKAGWSDPDKTGVLSKVINGKKTEFAFTLTYGNQDSEKYYTIYQEDLKRVGIRMDLKLLEWNAFVKLLDDGNFDAITLQWSGVVDYDPKQIWHSANAVKGGSNFIGYKNPKVDQMIDAAREEMDKKKRIPMMRAVYKQIADDAPYAFMFNDKFDLYGQTKRMGKIKPTYTYSIGRDYWYVQ
jgi:microcin C transport system substrate-binding protein